MKTYSKITLTLCGLAAAYFIVACSGNKPVYESTPDSIKQGSYLFTKIDPTKAECKSCHGDNWQGDGADKDKFTSIGLSPEDLTKSSKTAVDYFKALTVPGDAFKEKVQGKGSADDLAAFVDEHTYLTFTDKGRWAIANYLFSLNAQPNKSLYETQLSEVKKKYSEVRRWDYVAPKEVQKPDLTHAQAAVTEAAYTQASLSEARKNAAHLPSDTPGRSSYLSYCASCHGKSGEGNAHAAKLGLMNCPDMPRLTEGARCQAAMLSVADLANSPRTRDIGAFRSAHRGTPGTIDPALPSLTDQEWQDLFQYTRTITTAQ